MSDTTCAGCKETFGESDLIFTDSGLMCSPCAAQVDVLAMSKEGQHGDRLVGIGMILAGIAFIAVGVWLIVVYLDAVSAANDVSAVAGAKITLGVPPFRMYYAVPIPLGLAFIWLGIKNLRG